MQYGHMGNIYWQCKLKNTEPEENLPNNKPYIYIPKNRNFFPI